MKKLFVFPAVVVLAGLISCQKQQTEAEKNADVERQVQERLAAEHQAEQQQQLTQRQADLDAREKALADKEKAVGSAPARRESEPATRPRAISGARVITATSGNRAKRKVHGAGVRTPTVAGFTPTRAGPGFPKSHSVGPPITTDAGRVCAALVGFGFRAINGPRPGFPGERATITSAGRRCLRKRDSINTPASTIGPITITTSVRINIVLLRQENSARSEPSPRSSRQSAT